MRTIVRAFVLGLSLLSFHVAVFSQQVARKITYPASPDGIIGFLEFRPSDYGSQKHPLIIFLHGIGERGNGTTQLNYVTNNAIPRFCAAGASMRFTVGGQTSSFVVLSPQLSTQYGYWPTFYVKEMIKYAKANLQIDPDRIYVTGLSLGGGGIWRLITDTENFDHTFDATIAAAAPVCGTQEENDYDFCSTIGTNHLPVWAFHSMDDGTVGVGATQHAEILSNMCGVTPAPKFTYYQGGGHAGAWLNAYDTGHITTTLSNGASFTANPNLYEWFLGQTRSTAAKPTYTAPIANAGAAQIISLPINTVTLTGSASGTNGATISSYSWAKTSGPAGGVISLPLLNTTLVTGLVAGTYVFTLTVTDNHGLTSSSSVSITVNALLNKLPVSNAGSNVTITLPASSVTLNGSASSDPDGTIAGYNWTQTTGPGGAVIANRNAATTTVSGLVEGSYTYVLEVTDNGGLKAYSSVIVTVNAAAKAAPVNQLPVANAGSDATITLPANSVTLNGSASSDPDGTITGYNWTQTTGAGGAVMANRNAATTTVSGLVEGSYTYVLEVTDNGGLKAYSSVIITVNAAAKAAPVNQLPLANAGSDATITLPASAVTLNGSASQDPDGSIAIYRWTQTAGPGGAAMSNRDAAITTVTGLVAGSYTFVLEVTDNGGLKAYSSVSVNVNAAFAAPPPVNSGNQVPAANAGANIVITLPATAATLNGSASQDPDGVITAYRWTMTGGPGGSVMSNRDAAITAVTGLVEGTYTFVLEVTDNGGLKSYAGITITVNPAVVTKNQPTGYIKLSSGPTQACGDASTDGRIPIYTSSIANGSLVYLDAAFTQLFDGGWNWYSFTPTIGAAATQAFAVYPNGGIALLTNCSPASTPPVTTPTPPATSAPLGYVKISSGPTQACGDASSADRIAVYGSSITNGGLLYLDAAQTKLFDGGWNWYSYTQTLGGTVTQAFAVYPNGGIALLTNCAGTPPPVTQTTPAPASTLLGYIKMSTGPYQACDDASSAGRIAVYGTSVANGSYLYTDAALTQKYDGGWNWYSFTPMLGGQVTAAFAVYPIGSIGLMKNCANGTVSARMAAVAEQTTTTADNEAMLRRLKDSAVTASLAVVPTKLVLYPNPVQSTATVELTSTDNSVKTVNLYNANGVLAGTYRWQTVKGRNTFLLKNVAALAKGLYIIDIKDSNGKSTSKLKFIKM